MPIDLNQLSPVDFAELLRGLRPGQAVTTNDGIVVRRRSNSSGFDCNVGPGGHGRRRANNAAEAAHETFQTSAQHKHPSSLGGDTVYTTVEDALFAVGQGYEAPPKATAATPDPDTPSQAALRAVASGATVRAYRTRAQRAREALRKNDPAAAAQQLEAIIDHAGAAGKVEDAERAEAALLTLRQQHDTRRGETGAPTSTGRVVVHDGAHYVVTGARRLGPYLTREEALERKSFLDREAVRQSRVQAIDNEIEGIPNIVDRGGEAA